MMKIRLVTFLTNIIIFIFILSQNLLSKTGQSIDSWVWVASAPAAAASGVAVCATNDAVYVFRGGSVTFWKYIPSEDRWVWLSSAPAATGTGSDLVWTGGDFIYATRGLFTNEFWEYHISGDSWTVKASLPVSVSSGCSLAWTGGNYIYATQGDGTGFYMYDITLDQWVSTTSLPLSIGGECELAWDGGNYLYVYRDQGSTTCYKYDLTTYSWSTAPSLPWGSSTPGIGASLVWNRVTGELNNLFGHRGAGSTHFARFCVTHSSWNCTQDNLPYSDPADTPIGIGAARGQRLACIGDYIFCFGGTSGTTGIGTRDMLRYRWRDVDPPGKITGFIAETGLNGGEINLSWVCPGNDKVDENTNTGDLPQGSTFYIQYSSSTENVVFSTSSPQNVYEIWIPTGPVSQGQVVSYTVGGLEEGVTYYFRIWAKDNAGNWSEISDGATAWAMYTTDFTPPDAVSDLTALPISQDNQITLSWTAPGDDGSLGTLTGVYLIQYASQTTIDIVVWSTSNAQVIVSTSNVTPGSTQYYTLILSGGTTYYFRLWTRDEAYNYSTISNGATIYLGIYPPEPITDLTATLWNSTVGAVMLQWTAPSDPPSGTAVSSYIIKYATWNFTDADFDNVRKARVTINPKMPHETEILVLTGLPSDTTVYFRIKSVDSVNNISAIDTTAEPANVYVPPHLIISEFATRTAAVAGEEFVELYNPTDYDIPIGTAPGGMNLKLVRRNTSGGQYPISLTYFNHIIYSKGYFLLATSTNATGGVQPDGTFTGTITDGGTLFITFGSTSTVTEAIDLVAYGIITDPYITEYETLATTGTNVSIQRRKINNNFIDTNDNLHDFTIGSPDPQNTLYTAIPNPPSWREDLIEVSTGHIKWVIQDNAVDEDGLYISSAADVTARLSENLGPLPGTGTTSWWVEINLTSNTYYTRYAEAYKTTGSSWSAELSICTLAYPPEVVTATPVDANTIDISWNYSGATKYLIAYSTTDFTISWSTAAEILSPGTTHQHTGLTGNTTYYYRIYVYNQAGVLNQTFFSPTVSTMTYPSSPSGLTVTNRTTTSLTWSWFVPEGGCDGYRVYRATDNSLVANVGNNTSYTEQNLSTNTAYGRYVRAYNIVGESLPSNYATFYTLAVAPENLQVVQVYSSSVTLVWELGGNPQGTRFGVAYAEDESFTVNHTTFVSFADNLTSLTTTVTGLGGGTTYYFRVWAYNGDGIESGYSNTVSTCTLPGVPAVPSGLYAVALSTTSIKWEWNITRNATYYQIYNADNGSLLANLEGNGTTTWVETNLSPNTKYSRYVKAGNEYGLSEPSQVVSKYTLAYPPASLEVTSVSSSTINLRWNNSGAFKYQVRRSSDNFVTEIIVSTIEFTTFSDTGLTAGVTYYYRIYAVNHDSITTTAIYSPTVSTRTLPSPVESLSILNRTATSITWNWTGATGADGYIVYRATDNSVITTLPSSQLSYQETALQPNTAYGKYVRAFNTTGLGEKSPTVTYYTLANPPTGLQVTNVTHNSVSLSWSSNGNPAWTRYELYYSLDNFQTNFTTAVKLSDNFVNTSTTIVSLQPNTTYYFRVGSYNNDSVFSGFSNIVSTMTLPPPAPDICITEVLANDSHSPEGGAGEFVEIYNRGSIEVNLAGMYLCSEGDTNDNIIDYTGIHDLGQPGTILYPGWYALIVDPDYDGWYNNCIQQHADLNKLIMLTIGQDTTLGSGGLTNTFGSVWIVSGTVVLTSFTWVSDADNGKSWEKIDYSGPAIDKSNSGNWMISFHPSDNNSYCSPGFHSGCGDKGQPGAVVINEFLPDPKGTDNGFEWIEFFNKLSTQSFNLVGWRVQESTSGTVWNDLLVITSGTISENGYFLCSHSTAAVLYNADFVYSDQATMNNSPPCAIRLVDIYGTEIDRVAYGGTSSNFLAEGGEAALGVVSGSSYSRFPDGKDTNNNKADFILLSIPTPTNSSAKYEIPLSSGVLISQFATEGPNGSRDEFVEIYNIMDLDVNISGWQLLYQPAKSTTTVIAAVVPPNTRIKAKGYYLFGYKDFKWSVKPDAEIISTVPDIINSGGHWIIVNSTNVEVDRVGWGEAVQPEGTAVSLQPSQYGSYERRPGHPQGNYVDTNNNVADWIVREVRLPRNSKSPTEPDTNWPERLTVEPKIECYFTHGGASSNSGVKQKLIELINSAQRYVYCAIYTLTDMDIILALNNAANRGVIVRLVVDNYTWQTVLRDLLGKLSSSIKVRLEEETQEMHNKFVVIDGIITWTGSGNFATDAVSSQDNDFVILYSTTVAAIYEQEFKVLYEGFDKTYKQYYPLYISSGSTFVANKLVEILFSPFASSVSKKLLSLLNKAEESIFFDVYTFTNLNIGNVMLRKSNEGVILQGVIERTQPDTVYNLLDANFKNVRKDNNTTFMHSKLVIIDKNIVVTGSTNLTTEADSSNDENMVIIYSPEIARQFIKYHKRIYANTSNEDNPETPPPNEIPPSPVINLSCSAGSQGSLVVSWLPSTDIDFSRYYIFVKEGTPITLSDLADGVDNDNDGQVDEGDTNDGNLIPERVMMDALNTSAVIVSCQGQPLKQNVNYYIAVTVMDKSGNESVVATYGPVQPGTQVDTTPPGQITDLVATSTGKHGEIQLSWTAPGDDGYTGLAFLYELRYATYPFYVDQFSKLPIKEIYVSPYPAGQKQICRFKMPTGTTYYFAIRTYDEVGNVSQVSNIAFVYPSIDYVVINEFLYDPVGTDEGQEWIELFNITQSTINLAGFRIEKTNKTDWLSPVTIIEISSGTILPNGYFLLAQTTTVFGVKADYQYDSKSTMYNTPPCGIRLVHSLGDILDTVGYGGSASYSLAEGLFPAPAAASGSSLSRFPDGRDTNKNYNDFIVLSLPTPTNSAGPDLTPPGYITDLQAYPGNNPGQIILTWTTPGDDDYTGDNTSYARYIVKYATYPVGNSSLEWWFSAVEYIQQWPILAQGKLQVEFLDGFLPGVTYYFAIRTIDDNGNISDIDLNATSAITQAKAFAQTGMIGSLIRINEVAPDQTSTQGGDWIEFYNASTQPINIYGWKIYEVYTSSSTPIETIEANWDFPPNTYLLLRFGQTTRNMTTPQLVGGTYYELTTDKSGLAATDNIIILTDNSGRWIDVVCYADRSGSITNSTRFRAAYNFAVSTGQWFGPYADGTNDWLIEYYCVSTLFMSSNRSIARDEISTDGTNPSYNEWYLTTTLTRGSRNDSIDKIPPASITTLNAVAGNNRGHVKLSWISVGDDGYSGTASGYVLRYGIKPIIEENFSYQTNADRISKDGQADTIYIKPQKPGSVETVYGALPIIGVTYYFVIKVLDERVNMSGISNVVSFVPPDIVGSNIRINEFAVLESSATGDWVELYNASTEPVNIKGWTLWGIKAGETTPSKIKDLPDITIAPNEYLVVNCIAGTDETNSTGKGNNGYWDVYSNYDIRGFEGVLFLTDVSGFTGTYGNIVDFVAYTKGEAPQWKDIWNTAVNYNQWSPSISSDNEGIQYAVDWSSGQAGYSLGRDGFSTDTDNTLPQAKDDWKLFTIPTKGRQNDDIPPNSITTLVVSPGSFESAVKLEWLSPGDDMDKGMLNNAVYRIKCSTVDFTSFTKDDIDYQVEFTTNGVLPGTKVEKVLYYLEPGTTYYFGIIVRDDAGNWSSWYKDVNLGINVNNYTFALDLPPAPPGNITVENLNRAVKLLWTHPVPDYGDIDKYLIYMSTFSFESIDTPNVVNIATVQYPLFGVTITGLTNSVSYYFRILTVDKGDTGNRHFGEVLISTYLSVQVVGVPKILPPKYLSAKHYGDKVVLSWEHTPDVNADNFAGYKIYRSTVGYYYSVPETYIFVSSVSKQTRWTDFNVSKFITYYYIVKTVDTDGIESDPSNNAVAIPDLIPPEFVYVSKPYSRDLVKGVVRIELKVVDDRYEKGDRQGKIMFINGKYRKTGDNQEYEIVKFIPAVEQGITEYTGVAEFDITILNVSNEGVEYCFTARDEVNISSYPETGWAKLEPPKDKPEQKFITPQNPEVVFGKEVDEIVIRDYNGNEIWKQKSDGVNIIVWRGQDQQGKKIESGAYIYQIKTKDGKRKYGVVIVVK